MSTTAGPGLRLLPITTDSRNVARVAETISLSFAADPLISWLFPGGPRWGDLPAIVQKWQQHRVRLFVLEAITMEAISEQETVPKGLGVSILYPPVPLRLWLRPWWWPTYIRFYCRMFWDYLWETLPGDEKRVDMMSEHHDAALKKYKERYPSLYYLEICCAAPDAQGMGVGAKMMHWVTERLGDSPCFLECTSKTNVPFYAKYGFKLVEEDKLVDETDQRASTTLYYMIRDGAS